MTSKKQSLKDDVKWYAGCLGVFFITPLITIILFFGLPFHFVAKLFGLSESMAMTIGYIGGIGLAGWFFMERAGLL